MHHKITLIMRNEWTDFAIVFPDDKLLEACFGDPKNRLDGLCQEQGIKPTGYSCTRTHGSWPEPEPDVKNWRLAYTNRYAGDSHIRVFVPRSQQPSIPYFAKFKLVKRWIDQILSLVPA